MVKLKVFKALKEDVGRNRLRLPLAVRKKLQLDAGDEVVITNGGASLGLIVCEDHPGGRGGAGCRLDKSCREKLGVELGEMVFAEKDPYAPLVGRINRRKYDLVVVEKRMENPFQISARLMETASGEVKSLRTVESRARALFNWMQKNIRYGTQRRTGVGYRDSIEVKVSGEGVCGEQAYLYVSMARVVGLTANYASVSVDHRGREVRHACAALRMGERLVLVDPAYHTFDIAHQRYRVLSDLQAHAAFRSMRSRGPVAVPSMLRQ